MKALIRNKWFWITAVFWALTPLVFMYARYERGGPGIGGEIFVPMLPLLMWAIAAQIKRDRERDAGLRGEE